LVKLLATKTRQEQNFWKLVKFESFNIDKPRISFPIDIVNPVESAVEGAMREALQQARLAGESGDVPVGAVVVHQGKVISSRHNERELTNDPTAHAEILALRDAAKMLGTWRLTECTLVVTLEPCVMCAGALMNARIGTLVYATADLKGGATASLYNVCTDPRLNHQPKVVHGVCEREATDLMKSFFANKRSSE
jgi:tRNA(adenine34) deaminase